ncbi:MAG: VapE domain-containing protein [Phocaeicola sp.]|uniref:VapE domain-containing protein n=1 Tax=Phocaeicola TaxID=909656 RepID=UPI00234EDD60|nr:VapE domain-containing protein [Phocaeicola oris]MCE2617195.1 DUF3874 domain-containing protein [Phocaeicola oris]
MKKSSKKEAKKQQDPVSTILASIKQNSELNQSCAQALMNLQQKLTKMKTKKQSKVKMEDIINYLSSKYEFRHNELTDVTEYRHKGSEECFMPIDDRALNGIRVEAHLDGLVCWRNVIPTIVLSTKVKEYSPVRDYMNALPDWDGVDRVIPYLKRVSDKEYWLRTGKYWFRALTSQMMGITRKYGNTMIPVLISEEQGLGKSTYCANLLPNSLRTFYLDNIDLVPAKKPENKLAQVVLINLDEINRFSEKRFTDLKNLSQMTQVRLYKNKHLGYVTVPRLASFIATTNTKQVLSDPTGSRRFICVEVDHQIDSSEPEHKQFFAQLKKEVEQGLKDYMTHEEEKEQQKINKAYYKLGPLENAFFRIFRKAKENEKGAWLNSAEIYDEMQITYPKLVKGLTPRQLMHRFLSFRIEIKRINTGTVYHLTRL